MIQPARALKYTDRVNEIILINDWENEDFTFWINPIQITHFKMPTSGDRGVLLSSKRFIYNLNCSKTPQKWAELIVAVKISCFHKFQASSERQLLATQSWNVPVGLSPPLTLWASAVAVWLCVFGVQEGVPDMTSNLTPSDFQPCKLSNTVKRRSH